MGDGALTKEQLDTATAEWLEWRKGLDAPVASTVGPRTAVLIGSIIKAVAPHIVALEKQVAALQARVEELERRPELKYLGVFRDDGRKYSEGSAITHDGGIWIALKATTERPGHSADWQLAVKSGGVPTVSPRSDASSSAATRPNGHPHPNPRMR
jgi:hypothetical protein